MQKIYIETLGCARNQVDSETMAALLEAARLALTDDPQMADAIVVNTCSFIQSAADESIDTILALARYKREGRCRCLVVAGCLPQRYGRETLEAMPEVDILLGTGAYDQIVEAVSQALPRGTCLLPDPDGIDVDAEARRKPTDPYSAYLKIAEGCSRHCTYCIIPRLRGRQKSRPVERLVAEAGDLIARGVREIVLVAQESTAYGNDLEPPTDLSVLLERLAALDPGVWVRVLYGHPTSLTPAIIETMAAHANLCPYFDIPIQHAADSVLQRMGRHYGTDDLRALFGMIRRLMPQAALRTTLLVGFPGETRSEFQALMDFIQEVQFDHLGVFTYSDAEDLPSHGIEGHVSAKTARDRRAALMETQKAISTRALERHYDTQMSVLLEEHPEPHLYVARSALQAPEVDGCVYVTSKKSLNLGEFVTVRITDTLDYDLTGEPL